MRTPTDEAISEIIAVAAELIRGDGLPNEEDEKNGNRRLAIRMMRTNAIRRGNRLKVAVDAIRAELKKGAT